LDFNFIRLHVFHRPMPDQDKNVESTLIWFNRNDERENPYWGKELKKFIDTSEYIQDIFDICDRN